jgi:hypothetical protein
MDNRFVLADQLRASLVEVKFAYDHGTSINNDWNKIAGAGGVEGQLIALQDACKQNDPISKQILSIIAPLQKIPNPPTKGDFHAITHAIVALRNFHTSKKHHAEKPKNNTKEMPEEPTGSDPKTWEQSNLKQQAQTPKKDDKQRKVS